MELRPRGSAGHPAAACPSVASIVHDLSIERSNWHRLEAPIARAEEPVQDLKPEMSPRPPMSRAGTAAAIGCTVILFLLACAYSAFAGYAHSSNERYAFLAIFGAVGSLLIAEIGVCVAASRNHRRMSARMLLVAAVCSATLYAVLLLST